VKEVTGDRLLCLGNKSLDASGGSVAEYLPPATAGGSETARCGEACFDSRRGVNSDTVTNR